MSRLKALLAAILVATFPLAAVAQTGIQFGAGQILGNSTSAQRQGRAETVTAILDRALSSTRGSIIERGASGWVAIGPSATTGLAWVSQGAGADPIYGVVSLAGGGCAAALSASNGGILYSTASTCAVLAGTATARLPLLSGASTTPQWGAFTLPASVTSGGVPCFSSTSSQISSALLVSAAIVVGGGAGLCPGTLGSLGTTTTVLHGNAGGNPSFGAISNADLASATANTVKGNFTGAGAVPADNAMPSCSTSNSSLQYTSGTGLGCNTTMANLGTASQTITGGANVTSLSQSTGNITVDCGARPIQTITNNGAYTITAPTNDGYCILKVTNGASAGATSFSGFSVGSNTGDALTTTNTNKFMIFVYRAGADSTYAVKALQ